MLTYRRRIRRRAGALVISATAALAAPVMAVDINWIAGSGTFQDAANWSGMTVPGPGDRAIFQDAGVASILFESDATNQNLHIPRGELTFNLGGNTYDLAGTDSLTGRVDLTPVGIQEFAVLTLNNGTLGSRTASIGMDPCLGAVVFAKAGTTWSVSHLVQFGTGSATIEQGARMIVGQAQPARTTWAMQLGSSTGSSGNLLVIGPESRLDNHASVVIGLDSHAGFLALYEGGTATDYSATIGHSTGAQTAGGQVIVGDSGSSWTSAAGRTVGGSAAYGFVEVLRGGVMRTLGEGDGDSIDAPPGTTIRQVLVTGAGSRYVLDTGVRIGITGPALVEILQGGELRAGFINLGRQTGSSGKLTVSGAGSRVAVGSLLVVGADPQAGMLGTGSLLLANSAQLDCTGTTLVHSTGSVLFNSGSFSTSTLDVRGGKVLLGTGGNKVLRTNAVDITGTGHIDLADNAMLVNYSGASPIDSIRAQVGSAFDGGSWAGAGIGTSLGTASTLGIGYAEASSLSSVPGIFGDVDADTILIRFTRFGDANLDQLVNLADFNRLASNFGSSNALWQMGDFNYDATVNLQDFNLLAANFGLSASPNGPTPQDWANLAAVVPEPTSLVLTGVAASAAVVRRRRRG